MIFDKKNSKPADFPREKKKQMPTWFKSKVKIVAMMVVFALIWGQVPVSATVNDNLSSVLQKLIGAKTDTVTDSFENSSAHAKINYIEKQMVALQTSVEEIHGQNSAYSLYCYIQSADTRYEGCELTLTSASGNQVATGKLHLDKKLNKYVTNIYSNFNGNCTLRYGSVAESINLGATGQEHQLLPYISDLTVWVDSSNSAYNGKTVTLKDANGTPVQTATFKAANGHYEASMTAYANGNYTIDYPYILSSGNQLNLSAGVTLNGAAKRQQLFGDLQQMTMADVQAACKAGVINQLAKVGDTFNGGTGYTYTIIGIDQDKPSDGNGNLLPSNSYGNVLTVMPLGAAAGKGNNQPVATNAAATPYGTTTAQMNSINTNSGGWASSQMRSSTMEDYYNRLPEATRKVIGPVQKITGTYGGGNQTTGDSVFLLSGKELFGGTGNGNGSYCTTSEASATFQYQYFANIATTTASRAITGAPNRWWWLRSPCYGGVGSFCGVYAGSSNNNGAYNSDGVFAAFCIY